MKYFTYDLFNRMNNESLSEEEIRIAEYQWNENSVTYSKDFNNLVKRLPAYVFDLFKGYGFHDYQLVQLDMNMKSLLNINIDLLLENENEKWKISFTDISDLHFNHFNKNVKQPIFEPTLDLWIREEFTIVDDNNISFEVLFSSGANMKINFKDKNISLQKF